MESRGSRFRTPVPHPKRWANYYGVARQVRQVSDPTGVYGFAYDNMGRLIGTTTQYSFLPGQTFTNGYTYDLASNRIDVVEVHPHFEVLVRAAVSANLADKRPNEVLPILGLIKIDLYYVFETFPLSHDMNFAMMKEFIGWRNLDSFVKENSESVKAVRMAR